MHDTLLTEQELEETEEYFNAIITINDNNTTESKKVEESKPKKQCKGSECQKEFNNLLLETIEEVLTSLGAPVKNSIYGCLENNFEICKEQIPNKIVDFTDFLHKTLGTVAANRLEKKFIETLNKKISESINDFEYENSSNSPCDSSFNDFILEMRQTYVTNHQSDNISFEFK